MDRVRCNVGGWPYEKEKEGKQLRRSRRLVVESGKGSFGRVGGGPTVYGPPRPWAWTHTHVACLQI